MALSRLRFFNPPHPQTCYPRSPPGPKPCMAYDADLPSSNVPERISASRSRPRNECSYLTTTTTTTTTMVNEFVTFRRCDNDRVGRTRTRAQKTIKRLLEIAKDNATTTIDQRERKKFAWQTTSSYATLAPFIRIVGSVFDVARDCRTDVTTTIMPGTDARNSESCPGVRKTRVSDALERRWGRLQFYKTNTSARSVRLRIYLSNPLRKTRFPNRNLPTGRFLSSPVSE